MPKILPTSTLKGRDPKDFDPNKYSNNSSGGSVLDIDLERPKNYVSYKLIIL